MKFNKNKCFFASVYVAAVSAMTFTGFTSYAAEQNAQINETLSLIRGEEIQWGVSEIVQNAQPPNHPRWMFTENLIISKAGIVFPLYLGWGRRV